MMEYQFAKRMSNVMASAIREILKAKSDPKMISFAGGNPSAEAFPVEEIEKISGQGQVSAYHRGDAYQCSPCHGTWISSRSGIAGGTSP